MGSARAVDAGHPRKACCCACLPWYFWPLLAFIASVLFLLLGIWSIHLKSRFTPIYETIECTVGQPNLVGFSGNELSLSVEVICDNPNTYSIMIENTKKGKVYMGASRAEVGSLTQIPQSTLPAGGTGSITAKTDITLSGKLLGELIAALFGDVPIYMELDLAIQVDVNFLLGRFQTSLPFQKDCGMYLVGLPGLISNSNAARVGPMACSERGEAVTIPPANSESSDGDVPFSALSMDRARVEAAKRLKDDSLTASIAASFSFFALFFLLGSACILRHFLYSRGSEHNDDALPPSAVTIGKSDANTAEV